MVNIKVCGSGCANCIKLTEMCQEIINAKKIDGVVEKITDPNIFGELGVWVTPGLIINGKVMSSGKIPTLSTLEHWIMDAVKGA